MRFESYLFLKLSTANSGVTYMPKKSRFITLIESQYGKVSERLHKSAQHFFCHIF